MASLWEEKADGNSGNDNQSETLMMAATKPQDLVLKDLRDEELLKSNAIELSEAMFFSQQLNRAIFQIADYIPDLQPGKNSDFWKKKVIPTLVNSLTEDVKSRNTIVHALASVRDLAICIQKSGEIIKDTRGSRKAIDIAKQNIPMALQVLERSIESANKLENSAVFLFKEHAEEFFEIIGPQAANFAEQKATCDARIAELEKEKQIIIEDFANIQGELEKYNNLVHVTEARVHGTEAALNATRLRTEQMQKLNEEVDMTIKAIPDTETKTETIHTRGFLFWKGSTTTRTFTVKNPDRESEKNYYESVILARSERIKDSRKEEKETDDAIHRQKQDLAELQGKYTATKQKYEKRLEEFPEKLANVQKRIDAARRDLEDLEKTASDIETTFGLKGSALIQCLVAVRAFTITHKEWAQMYSPLASLLNGIRQMVKTDIDLLDGDDTDVFLAGKRLLRMVGFLVDYSANTRKMISDGQKLDSSAVAMELKFNRPIADSTD